MYLEVWKPNKKIKLPSGAPLPLTGLPPLWLPYEGIFGLVWVEISNDIYFKKEKS